VFLGDAGEKHTTGTLFKDLLGSGTSSLFNDHVVNILIIVNDTEYLHDLAVKKKSGFLILNKFFGKWRILNSNGYGHLPQKERKLSAQYFGRIMLLKKNPGHIPRMNSILRASTTLAPRKGPRGIPALAKPAMKNLCCKKNREIFTH